MAQPVTLYPADGEGEPLICAAPSEVERLLKTGEWFLEPQPKPKPKTTTRRRKPAKKSEADEE